MEGLDRDGIILFTGDGCPACERAKPVYHEFFGEQNQSYTMIDVGTEQELVQMLNIRGIPTLIFFKDGEEQNRIVGVPDKVKLLDSYEEWVDKDAFQSF